MIYEMNHIWTAEMKWNEGMIVAVKRNLSNCVKKPEKNSGLQRGLNPWPRDTGAMLYQLSYEATDVGSRSIVGSYVPVKEMSVNDIWNESYMNCGNEMKWRYDRRSETQFKQLRKEAWKKFRTSTGFEPVTSRYRCDVPSTNWAMKPLTLGAGQLWVHMFPWKKWVLMIYEMNHIWTAEMKWNEGMIVAVKRNLSNCVKKPEKNSGLQRGLNPWPRDTGAMLYQLSYEATDVGSRSIVGSYVPVKEMSVNDIWNESYMNCGNEMKWRYDRRSETQFKQLRKEAWKKFRTSTGFEPVTLAIPVRCSTNWALIS